jgi:DNA-binding response OmpR family regulator
LEIEDMKNINVLIVEDDVDINNLLSSIMQRNGYNTRSAFSGSEARMYLEMYDYQMVLLDLMIPAVTGEELIEKIRQVKIMPIIVISAKNTSETKIDVLKLGADDFISKPFDVDEVLARVESQLRRYMIFSNIKINQKELVNKDIRMDFENHRIFVNGTEIILTSKEFSILELFLRYPNKVFTKANLFENIWNDRFMGDDNTINVHISNIRSKIAAVSPDKEYIQTVWGIGFKMQE